MKHLLLTTIAAVLLVGCGGYEQPATSLQTNSVEAVAEIDKTELTSESAVGFYKWPGTMTLLIHKNGTSTTIVGREDKDRISGTWSIKDGKIEVNSNAPDLLNGENVVIYEMLDNGNLKHPIQGEFIKNYAGHTIESYLEL